MDDNDKTKKKDAPPSKAKAKKEAGTVAQKEETDEEYRLRVYGTISPYDDELDQQQQHDNNKSGDETKRPSLIRQFSRSLSTEWERRRRSSLKEQLPQTTYGWAIFLSSIASMTLRYELSLQKSLTCPPLVYGQIKQGPLKEIHEEMTKSDTSILVRRSDFLRLDDIDPCLFGSTEHIQSHTCFGFRTIVCSDYLFWLATKHSAQSVCGNARRHVQFSRLLARRACQQRSARAIS